LPGKYFQIRIEVGATRWLLQLRTRAVVTAFIGRKIFNKMEMNLGSARHSVRITDLTLLRAEICICHKVFMFKNECRQF